MTLVVAERREGICNRDELVIGRVLLRVFRRHGVGIRRRAWHGQGAVDERRVRLRLGTGGMRARLFLTHLAGWGLLRLVLLRALLPIRGGRGPLGGWNADAAGRCRGTGTGL